MSRKSMNFGLPRTVRKFFNVSETLGGGASPTLFGSRKKIRTATNMAKTLSAATRKTYSTPKWRCAQEATYGPEAPPMFTRVQERAEPMERTFSWEAGGGVAA